MEARIEGGDGLSVVRIFLDAARQVRSDFWKYFEFDLFFKVVSFILLQPVLSWLIGVTISSTGYPAVSNESIISFLLTPVGVLLVMFLGAGTIAILFAETAGLHLVQTAGRSNRELTGVEVLWRIGGRAKALSKLGGTLILCAILVALPFLIAGGVTYRALLSGADINYYLAVRPPEFWLAVGIGIVLFGLMALVAAMLYGRWVFSVTALLYEGTTSLGALRRSRELGRGRRTRIVLTVLAWSLLVAAAAVLVSVVFDRIGVLIVGSLAGSLRLLLGTLGLLAAAYAAAMLLLSVIAIAVSNGFINLLYARMSVERGPAPSMDLVLGPEPTAEAQARFRRANGVAWLAAGAALVVSAGVALAVAQGFGVDSTVEVTAHRGSSQRAPENTLSALRAAIEDGADFAEIDVQETADGVIVLLHDADLQRLAGVDWKIWEVDYERLKELDVGSWFAPEFEGERIATLADAIRTVRDRLKLNIELKYNGHDERLAERVIEILRAEDFIDDAIISALEIEGLAEVRRLDDQVDIGFIVAKSIGDIGELDVDFFSLSTSYASERLVNRLQRRDKEVHVWTVNTRQAMSSFIDLGVDNIITDYPAVLREMLAERAGLDESERVLLAFRNWLRRQ